MKPGYTPKQDRKTILLITDDIRVHSGVGNMGREIVINTAHRFNWVCIGGALKHPEQGKKVDLSSDTNKHAGIEDSSVLMYPVSGYGDMGLVRHIIKEHNVDAMFLITDPRYFVWVFAAENEIRKKIPIAYLNIWDSPPAPMYNKDFYKSCDLLMGISKQTTNINRLVLGKDVGNRIINYVPHGISTKHFYPITEDMDEYKVMRGLQKELIGHTDDEFILLFNSRNIRRKSIPDTLFAWRLFIEGLPKGKAKKCRLLLHTDVRDDNGTDINAVQEYLSTDDYNVTVTNRKFNVEQMNLLYNMSDGVILLSSNEGWGLSLTEAIVTGKMVIANVTGGMQDQMRFVDDDGNWLDFSEDIPSNHRGTFKEHGSWAIPVFPSNMSIQGSVPTPYIFDDRCSPEDASKAIRGLYDLTPEQRTERGLEGLKWATGDEAGFTAEKMASRVVDSMEELFQKWTPREPYSFVKDTDLEPRRIPHKLLYE